MTSVAEGISLVLLALLIKRGLSDMYEMISKGEFRDRFRSYGREDNFSYEGLGYLYDFLEEVMDEGNGMYELDVVSLCCDYAEDDIENVLAAYSLKDLEELKDNTCVILHDEERVLYAVY